SWSHFSSCRRKTRPLVSGSVSRHQRHDPQQLDGVNRVWLLQTGGTSVPIPLTDSSLHLAARYPAGDLTVALYQR
ncbi:hypothetical protein AB0L41_48175, partial [Amycolatopsis mediterranei]